MRSTFAEVHANKLANVLSGGLSAKNLTRLELARLVGVEPSSITRWLDGERTPKVDNLRRLAGVLELDFHELLQVAFEDSTEKAGPWRTDGVIALNGQVQALSADVQDLRARLDELVESLAAIPTDDGLEASRRVIAAFSRMADRADRTRLANRQDV